MYELITTYFVIYMYFLMLLMTHHVSHMSILFVIRTSIYQYFLYIVFIYIYIYLYFHKSL